MKTLERLFWIAGIVLLAIALFGWGRSAFLSRRDVAQFEKARAAAAVTPTPSSDATTAGDLPSIDPERLKEADSAVDTELWSPKRVQKYRESLEANAGLPLALLRIPSIDLVVAVFEGTGELVLNRGLGHIAGTPLPGEHGNIGIAGHRDGFFRKLKDVGPGDHVEIETLEGSDTYVIDDIRIVLPENVEVLDPTDDDVVTLVTCYPFYFVGKAPKRYIVRAVKVRS